MEIVHATAIAIDGKGVLLVPPVAVNPTLLYGYWRPAASSSETIALRYVRDDFVVARVPETIAET